MWIKVVASRIFFLNYLLLSLVCQFLCFSQLDDLQHQSLLFKSIGIVFNLSAFEALTNLAMSSLSTSSFKAIKSFFAAKSDVSTHAACSYSFLAA